MKKKNKNKHYVNNEKFLECLIEYKNTIKKHNEAGLEQPKIPDYIGLCLFNIATRLATKPNFASYIYKDEMISDGIENCIVYINNFNPKKFNNPFAYFTRIIWFAFLRRIDKEKKIMYIKHKYGEKLLQQNSGYDNDDTDANFDGVNKNVGNDYINDFVENYEKKLKQKKLKLKRKKDEKQTI